jgi:hypothetical protein
VEPILPVERSTGEPSSHAGDDQAGPWLALFLLTLAMMGWLGFQTFQLVRERTNLETIKANQETSIAQAQRVRSQVDSIARRTFELAQQGNSGAAAIVEQLARWGVTINPASPTPAPAPGSGSPAAPPR